jgi:hypothetical protein
MYNVSRPEREIKDKASQNLRSQDFPANSETPLFWLTMSSVQDLIRQKRLCPLSFKRLLKELNPL